MKKILLTLLISIFLFGSVFSIASAGEEENGIKGKNISQTSKTNTSMNQSFLENNSCPANVTKKSEVPVLEQKFRIAPTVVLRPVNDVITENEDGLVELYIDNPSLNDITLNVDARISVPAGIHVYGQGFAQTGAAGTVYGTFSVPSATARTFYIDIKGDKPGTYTIHFSGLYWPGDNKDAYNPISLTHPFVVEQPSSSSSSSDTAPDFDTAANLNKSGGVKAEAGGSFSAPGFSVLFTVIGLLAVYGSHIKKRK